MRLHVKPTGANALASASSAPASAGVILGQRISAWVSAMGSSDVGTAGSFALVLGVVSEIPQQVVDRGLGARLLVDALHDHRAVKAGPGLVVGERLARQRAGHDHGVGRHLAVVYLAGGPVDDLG